MKKLLLTFLLAIGLATAAQASAPQAVQYYQYGVQLYNAKQYDQALKYFAASLKLDNRQATVYQAVGNCYYAKGDRANATRYYKYSLQMNPGNASLQQFVARLEAGTAPAADPLATGHQLYRAQRYSEALQSYEQARISRPGDARVWQSLGNAKYALQDKAGAIAAYKRSLELNPNNPSLAAFVAKSDGGTAVAGGDGGWFQPAWRSAILPGWGQYYNGEKGKGLLIGAVTLGLFAGEVATFVIGDQARQTYLGLSGPSADYDTPYATWESMASLNHMFFWGMTAAYTYNVVDAVMNSGKKQLAAADPPAFNLALAPDQVKASYRLLEF